MNPDRWRVISSIVHEAFNRHPSDRDAFVAHACANDPSLKKEVDALIRADQKAETFLEPPRVSGTAELIGERVGSYELQSEIGSGGMGIVYRALDMRLNRFVAVKFLSSGFNDQSARYRFERETSMASSLNHPHIVTVHEAGEFKGRPFLVTEFIDGGTLLQWASSRRPTWREIVELLAGVADGLACAHEAGVLHRDIKPQNILVTKSGYAKLADFGLATHAVRVQTDLTGTLTVGRTQPGMIIGTVAYMSPEQASGKMLDARSDVFSFGVVLYELLTGRRPFMGATDFEILHTIVHGTPQPLGDDIPPRVRGVVEKTLEKDVAGRYQSMRELVIDLRRLLRQATEAAPITPHPARSTPEHMPSIAVLPFADLSAAKDQDWFCDGIAEEILNALSLLNGLRVAARTSAFSFRGKSDDLRTIGEKLHVSTVLGGSVRRVRDRVRITAQLSDVQNGYQLWSERYDRELQDIFDVQDEIAKAIAERLKLTLAGDRLVEPATANMEAYQAYLKGRALLGRRGASIPLALDLFRKVVELDPAYSLAWAGLADSFTGLTITGSVSGSQSKTQAIAAATRSIELDPMSAAGHSALACATLLYENNRAKASLEFERALQFGPNYVLGRCWYALFYLQWACGEFERGIEEARRAIDIDPLSSYLSMILACCLCTSGRLDDAIETAYRAVQYDPESFVARWILGVSLGTAERFEEAISVLNFAAGISGRHARALTSLAAVFGHWKKPSEAGILHRELLDRSSTGYVPSTYLALSADASGARDEALTFARHAWKEREPTFILHAPYFTEFRSLRSDPQFRAILSEMDSTLPHEDE